ncbi:hypothetical protein MACJ_003801 [Theileria orientalis]|uniref:Uncharacterized protein n=1 Tax=Theileria orientalis TaxID=68886 RepID=A0A976SKL0_THEOR|nr:hypothetical protein MACJ_003801 [Theileria orientalis]
MCNLGLILGTIVTIIYYITLVESDYKFGYSPSNEEFISKDLSGLGLNVYLEEFDFIPKEVSSISTNVEVCKESLKRIFEDHVYGLCEHFKCDIGVIATKPYDKRVYPLSTAPAGPKVPKTENVSEEDRSNCELAKLAARCSSYLKFANCIYDKYIASFKIGTGQIKLSPPIAAFYKRYPNNVLVDKYNAAGGGEIGFLFREFLQNICSFVHNSCHNLHPQFKGTSDYFWSQACIVFDTITPLGGIETLFINYADDKQKISLESTETDEFLKYSSIQTDLILSQLNIPVEGPINSTSKLTLYQESLFKIRCDIVKTLYVHTKQLSHYKDPGKYRIYSLCFQLEKDSEQCKVGLQLEMSESDCESFIKNNELPPLVNWLNESATNIITFWMYISENAEKSAEFICEHTYFVYTGRIKRSIKVFKDEDMNLVASTLGSASVYEDGRLSAMKDEYEEVKGYRRPEDFMQIYSKCCQKVDAQMAFSSIMQIIKSSGDDFGKLIEILGKVIIGSENGSSSLATNSLVSILGYVEENKSIHLGPVMDFMELLLRKREEDDAHGVVRSSLKDFSTKMIMKLKLGSIKVVESDVSPDEWSLKLGEMACKKQQNLYNWVCGLSLRQSAPVSGPLDSFPLNDAVCIYLLLESSRSVIPKVYSLMCMGLMTFKLSHVFLSNLSQESTKKLLSKMAIESAEMATKYIEAASRLSGEKAVDDLHMFPWHPVGYLSTLLNEAELELDKNRVANVFKRVLDLSVDKVNLHILKSVMKSADNEYGRSLCLMECKNMSTKWEFCEECEESQDQHVLFFKYVLNLYFELPMITTLEYSICDSLSVLLNWIKYLLMSKSRSLFKKVVKREYLDPLHGLYSKLNEKVYESGCSHASHIRDIFLNRMELIKFLMEDLFVLIDRDD